MTHAFLRVLPALALALLASCSPSPSDTGSAQLAVSARQALVADISRVSITSSAADIPSITIDLAPTHGVWSGTLGNIPAGTDRSFLAQAFDDYGNVIYEGSASGITIYEGQSAFVAITLQQVDPPPPFSNEAPIIDSLVVATTTVPAGSTLSLEATVHDPNPDDGLSYFWSSTDGGFWYPYDTSVTWVAPWASGPQTLTFTVTDSAGLTSTLSLTVYVTEEAAPGDARLDISFNSSPSVQALTVSSGSPMIVGQSAELVATVDDPDGDELSYAWSASCDGSMDNAGSSTAHFTPTSVPSETCNNCTLTVSVSDGHGGQTTGTVALCVTEAASPSHAPPRIIRSYSSSDTAVASQILTFDVAAMDPEATGLNFSWSANMGSLISPTTGDSSSRVTWRAPECAGADSLPTITATVTNGFNASATWSFTVTGLPGCSSAEWTMTGAMTAPRIYHPATLLPNGKVLVAGGYNYAGYLNAKATAELYDPATGTWSETGSMRSARYSHSATVLSTGKVLVAGGNHDYEPLPTAELYDPATGSWTQTGSMTTPRISHTATLLPNGKVLVAGGYKYNNPMATAELYDPATGTWSATGSMSRSRVSHKATLLPNGKVLVVAGTDFAYGSTSAEVYDPATGTWSATGSMALARSSFSTTLLPNGKVLVVGGISYDSAMAVAELYDPATGTWSQTGATHIVRAFHAATLLSTGKVLIMGGYNLDAGSLATAELYDPATGTWSSAGFTSGSRDQFTATLLNTGKVLIMGGNLNNNLTATAELYTPPSP